MKESEERNDNGSACGCGGGRGCCGPTKWIWIALIVAIAGVLIAKHVVKKDTLASCSVANCVPMVTDVTGTKAVESETFTRAT